jgi:hypothetical protein
MSRFGQRSSSADHGERFTELALGEILAVSRPDNGKASS